MMTHRERREARAERLRDWAGKRETKSAAAFETAHQVGEGIPFGQPILVGHHSEGRARKDQQRIENSMRAGVENMRTAERHSEKADNIERQLDASIYSDDEDAIERLEERLEGLEAERDRIKAYNASCRKGQPDVSLLDEGQRASLETVARFQSYALGKNGAMPTYALSNLSGNIKRNRDRLEQLKREASTDYVEPARLLNPVRYGGTCRDCGATIEKGGTARYYRKAKELACYPECVNDD